MNDDGQERVGEIAGPCHEHEHCHKTIAFGGLAWNRPLQCSTAPNSAANARLIAAAPDLLEACCAVLAGFESGVLCRNTDSDGLSDWAIRATPALAALGKMKAAIAKAEGRS